MAFFYSDVADNQNDAIQLTKERQPEGDKVSGDLLIADVVLTLDGTETASDFFRLVKLKEGSVVIPHLCQIVATVASAISLVGTLGDDDDTTAADADRYSGGVTINAQGNFSLAGGAAADLAPYKLQKDSWIEFDPTTVTTVNAGDTIRFLIAYRAQS